MDAIGCVSVLGVVSSRKILAVAGKNILKRHW
jgi:hypothetical protein